MKSAIQLFLIALVVLSGCSLDPCEGMNCANQGRCLDGACDCAAGFEGENCELREIDKYLGTYYRGTGNCSFSDFPLATHVITEHVFDNRTILIDDGVLDEPIRAVVDGWNFEIPLQRNAYTDTENGIHEEMDLWGLGWMDLESGLLVYQLDNSGCRYELQLN